MIFPRVSKKLFSSEKIPVKIEKTSSAPVVAKEKEPALQPLIPVAEEEPAADVIAFAGGEFELSAENTARLAAIADGFKRPGESKILIYAYNFNDGGNDFKNKRLSLNRAVENPPTHHPPPKTPNPHKHHKTHTRTNQTPDEEIEQAE